ncbi:uncharacterized protein MONBRDRAFT_23252 [Monosiga brevicollis MX1]|uniref:Coiled-coil domain-containing protein 61 n=1 Tax=Monosiga brevicollis TaxID=81824 RepID=A9URM2_MONBE|nr:uncharacterized protein MONBRDRAFT_23252 [Monosiga brevicollis MX1]EDQ92267.1 predicted protein [Monosiga brevicollis MX1]|eukprot:XP_001743553.1 hypothetical protein [Monosiga brevicollis MX1]
MASEIGAGLGAPPPSSISSSGAPAGLVVACVFNDALHQVQVAILPAALVLKIQDDVTGEEWTGSFTTAYVEDMTARTGNFKSFTTFTAMLTRSLSHPTPQLQLHWLTYRALQRLRSQPAPSEPELASFESSQGLDAADPTASRRYLILTYTSEFDRTHYPLPLECAAPPTVGALAARLRHLHHDNQQLRQALDAARSQPTPPPTEHPDAPANKGASKDSPLTAIVEAQMQEIDELRQIISQQRTDLEALHQTVAQRPRGPSAQDLDMLRTMISQLEHDLLEQKNRHQSLVAGKNTQLQRLRAELEAVSANERALQLKCRNLSAQLHARSASTPQRRSNPVGSTGKAPASGPRPRAAAVEERRASASRSRSASRPANTRQAASTEPRGRDRSRSRSVSVHDRAVSRTGAARQSTPSRRTRSASPRPRFDPTAYVKERQAKIEVRLLAPMAPGMAMHTCVSLMRLQRPRCFKRREQGMRPTHDKARLSVNYAFMGSIFFHLGI